MAKSIRGINVVIGAETTGLSKALTDVNKKSRDIQKELRQVDRLLKFNPRNTELLAQKQKLLGDQVANTREKLDRLKVAQAQVNEQFRRGEISEGQYRAFQRELIKTESQLKHFERQLAATRKSLDDYGKSMQDAGRKMTDAGKNLSMKVTAPIVALGAVIAKTGMEFESSMSQVQALSGATAGEMQKMEEVAKQLGATTVFSASQAAEGMAFLAMAGWETQDILAGIPGILDLAAAGAMDLGRAADITSNIMSAFAIEAEKAGHVADVLAAASSNANTNLEQMGTAMTYLAPVANTLGWSLEESAAAVMVMSDAGLQGEKAGAAFATSLQRLAKPSAEAKKVIDELKISFFDAEGQIKPLPQLIGEVQEATKDLTSEQEAAKLSTIFGAEAYKNWAVLLEAGSETLGKKTQMLHESEGAAKQMAETMLDNTKGAIEELKSALEGLAIQISEHILPAIKSLIEYGTGLVQRFSEAPPIVQKITVAIAALAAAIGPLLIVVGLVAQGLGAIMLVLPKLGAAFTALTGPVGLVVAGLAAAAFGISKLVGHLKSDAIPVVDLFGEEVSEATQQAVGGFLDLHDKATIALSQLSWSSQIVTQEMANGIVETYGQMSEQILSSIKERHNQSIASMKGFLADSSNITQEQQAQILSDMEKHHKEQEEIVANGEKRIKEILEVAAKEKRQLKEEEKAEIEKINNEVKELGIRHLSESEEEHRIILSRMKNNAEIITAEQAAEVVRSSKEQADKTIEEAERQRDKTIAEIEYLRDEVGAISEEQAKMLIEEARKQCDEVTKEAEEMHQNVIEEAKARAQEHADLVDWETGEVLSKWEVMKNNVTTKAKELKENMFTTWEDVKTNTSQAWENIKTSAVNAASSLYTSAKGKLEELWAYIKDIPGQAVEWGADIIQGLWKGISESAATMANNLRNWFSKNVIGVAKSILGIASPSKVFMTIGREIVTGLGDGVNAQSGYAVDQIKRLGDKLLNTGDAISTGLIRVDKKTGEVIHDNTYKNIMKRIDLYYRDRDRRVALMTDATDANIKQLQKEIDATQKATDIKIKLYEQEYRAKSSLVDDEYDARVKALYAEIDAIDKLNEQEKRAREEQEYQDKITNLWAEYDAAVESEQDAGHILDQIHQVEAERRQRLVEQERRDRQQQIREQIELERERAAEKKRQLEEELEEKRYNLEQQRIAELEHMNQIISFMQEQVRLTEELEKVQTDIKNKELEIQTKQMDEETKEQTKADLAELKEREKNLKKTIANNQSNLEAFTPRLQQISNRYGQVMLAGFKSTESQIKAYINDLIIYMQEQLAQAGIGGALRADGYHAQGLAYVPYDNYRAILHEGERVLTKAENREYTEGGSNKGGDVTVVQHIYSPTPDPRTEQRRAAREFKKLALGV